MRNICLLFLCLCLIVPPLFSQEKYYCIHNDVTVDNDAVPSVNSIILDELPDLKFVGNIQMVEEQQKNYPQNEDGTLYFVQEPSKKYSRAVISDFTKEKKSIYLFDDNGNISSIEKTTVNTTSFKKVPTKQLTGNSDSRRRFRIKGPAHTSTEESYQQLSFTDGLPTLLEHRDEKDDNWEKLEALQYDSAQRIASVFHNYDTYKELAVYKYNSDDLITSEVHLSPHGVIHHLKYIYNDSLRCTQVVDCLKDTIMPYDSEPRDYTCHYDNEGRLTLIEGKNLAWYNPYPHRACSISIAISKISYYYDEHGSLRKKCYETDDIIYAVEWEYKYDANGNWISCGKYEDGKLVSITVRKITYR
ncbi:MAG: hypothetical protein K6A41_00230 [Bacteroidales bacterium]|nr:hypothetical protein [Bacteroidales bacterium]